MCKNSDLANDGVSLHHLCTFPISLPQSESSIMFYEVTERAPYLSQGQLLCSIQSTLYQEMYSTEYWIGSFNSKLYIFNHHNYIFVPLKRMTSYIRAKFRNVTKNKFST